MSYLHHVEEGKGRPLILLHGNGEDGTYFSAQVKYFSSSRRVIAVDTRGHGSSPRGTAPFTIRQFADDLAGFMKDEGIEKADILGFSDGGNTALIFAVEYPDMLDHLIVDGANLNPGGLRLPARISIEAGYRLARLSGNVKRAEMLGLMVNDPDIEEADLGRIKAPVLVMAGTRDLIRKEHTLMISRSIPNAEMVFVKGTHFVARENPADFNAAAEEFLERRQL